MHQATACMCVLYDACNLRRYNETLVALYGASASTAIYATGTFGAAAEGHPAPYTLVMQAVLARCQLVTLLPCRAVHPFILLTSVANWAQDCNLVLYDGNAPSSGYSVATAAFYSGTYGAGVEPCSLVVSSAAGGFFAVVDATGAVVFQRPAGLPPSAITVCTPAPPTTVPPPTTMTPPSSMPAPPTTVPPPTTVTPPSTTPYPGTNTARSLCFHLFYNPGDVRHDGPALKVLLCRPLFCKTAAQYIAEDITTCRALVMRDHWLVLLQDHKATSWQLAAARLRAPLC